MGTKQFLRKCSLIVSNDSGEGLDLSALSISFKVKKSDAQTPNKADIRVYNLKPDTAKRIEKEFTRLSLSAGYQDNAAVIFAGNIKQAFIGRDNGTDTYLDIIAADGDEAYNFSVINTTLAAGATQRDQLEAAFKAMKGNNIIAGHISDLGGAALPRAKVMFGMTRDYLRRIAETTATSWSIQDGALQVLAQGSLLPSQAVVLNSRSGLLDSPEQTNKGIKVKCLLNPLLKIGGKIHLNEEDIVLEKVDKVDAKKHKEKKHKYNPVAISSDGFYRLLSVEHTGDTRGDDWISELVCIDVDASAPKDKQVADEEDYGY